MTDRREFIKRSCAACAGLTLFGLMISELESCKTADSNAITVAKKQVTVPLSQMGDKNVLTIKSASLDYDIALVKKTANEYLALQMICTHRQNRLTAVSNGFYCPSHGSEFDTNGNVTKGPASFPLKKFPTEIKGNKAIISI